ncbi:IgGFc-binding protein [Chryseobacterium sp. SL1]|uniref:IgGFc-binding protein n=1 Tax=Chryseobacterium sp. SL1 TaxID=2995159 RepID=UPI0022759909|nr:IgGFc-binding protein [Chryseobacterium sp. SL1]MCY1660215.1 IgGFc-binding protein [Chryseobacterium sp. SL1]
MKRLYLFIAFLTLNFGYAQLDNLHYLQPIIFGSYLSTGDQVNIEKEFIYLSTPSLTNITVKVTTADGNTIPKLSVQSINASTVTPVTNGLITLSNSNPVKLTLVNSSNNAITPGTSLLTLPTNNAGTIISAEKGGLIFASSDNFYVNYRGAAVAQAGSVMTKGKAALGKIFFWGGAPTEYMTTISEVGNMASIMATQNNTTVTISNIDFGTQFINGTSSSPITGSIITRTLQKGQSFILYAPVRVSQLSIQDTGWLGAKISANNDIAVTVGGLMQQGGSADGRDFGMDQLVPIEKIGNEYVIMQGNGGGSERVIVIATEANTTVRINGSTNPGDNFTLTNAGDYKIISAISFTNKNMYLKSNKGVYVFHKIFGNANLNTNSLMFIPPLSCFGQKSVDLIPDAKRIGEIQYDNTELAVLAANGIANAPVVKTLAGTIINPILGTANIAVPGNSNWRSYRYDIGGISNPINNIKISSDGTIQAELLGGSVAAGFGGYYSGFGDTPNVRINISGSPNPLRPCTGNTGSSVLSVSTGLGTYQWYKNGIQIPGATTNIYTIPVTDIISAEYNVIITFAGGCLVYSNVVSSFACPCYKPGTAGTPQITKIGISTRAQSSTPNFPADRNNGFIALESNNKGMVISRIQNPEVSIAAPVDGMIIHDIDENCIKIYNGTKWSCINQTCN